MDVRDITHRLLGPYCVGLSCSRYSKRSDVSQDILSDVDRMDWIDSARTVVGWLDL
jgi:hypothetical protein